MGAHGAQHISEPAKINAGFSMYHRPSDLGRWSMPCRVQSGRKDKLVL